MAEGGRPPDLNLHLLECPICLERFQQPKYLPCLHTFCQDCLGTYITKEFSGKIATATCFPCPVCRTMITPVNPATSVENWAENFPANDVVKNLIELTEASSEPLFCKPCQNKNNTNIPAKFWCKTMNETFCDTCKVQLHDIIHKDCGIVDIKEFDRKNKTREKSVLRCEKHGEKKTWYCDDHHLLCCNECVIDDHRPCDGITKTTAYFERLKSGTKINEMEAALKKGAETMNSLVKDFDEQLQNLMQNQDTALTSITDLRRQVDVRLDELQREITDKLVAMFKKEKNDLEASLQQSQHLLNGMLNTLKATTTAVEDNNHIETIMLYQRGKVEVESCKAIVRELSKTFTSVSIEHQSVPVGDVIRNDLMGKIVVKTQPRCIPGSDSNLATPLSERCIKEIGKFTIKLPSDKKDCRARGVVYLPCGQIVLSDNDNNKLKLFTDKGQYLDVLSVRGYLQDMCLLANNTIAVSCFQISGGLIMKVAIKGSKLSIVSEIKMAKKNFCFGITHTDGKFALGTFNGEVCNVTQDGTAESLHQYGNTCWSLTHDQVNHDTLVSVSNTTPGEVAVSRLSADRRRTDVMKVGVVEGARGIDVDREGNIYVCGMDSHNIVQISWNGTHARELLTSSDGINCPWAISVFGDRFVITNASNTDERNYTRIFQLY